MSNLSVTSSLAAPVYSNPLTRADAENIQQNELTAGVSRSVQSQASDSDLGRDQGRALGGRSDPKALPIPVDENTPAGPPPAFEASLLDVETKLSNIIKRIVAAREQDKTADAVRAEPVLIAGTTATVRSTLDTQ